MRLETDPPLSEEELAALQAALVCMGITVDASPEAYTSRWRQVAAREAIENESRPVRARYAPSPRSTRGATRA